MVAATGCRDEAAPCEAFSGDEPLWAGSPVLREHSWSQTFTFQYQLGFRKCSEMVVTSVELHWQGRGSASQLAGGFPTVRLSTGPGTICPRQPPASPGHPSAGSWCSPGTKETTASAMVWGMKVAARPHLHGAERA